jgi:GNAT superfamily N-acetyltransferase
MSLTQWTTIREFGENDLIAVRDLIHRTIDYCYFRDYPVRAIEYFKEFHSENNILQRFKNGTILVAEQHGNIIGTGSIVGFEIFGVFVHPEFQHFGHGKELMWYLEDKARGKKCCELNLSVSLPSIRFYETLGYTMVKKCSIDIGDGQQLCYWMAKKTLKNIKSESVL